MLEGYRMRAASLDRINRHGKSLGIEERFTVERSVRWSKHWRAFAAQAALEHSGNSFWSVEFSDFIHRTDQSPRKVVGTAVA